MFGLACSVCWDRNCNCTQEEIDEYKEGLKNKAVHKPLEYTKTKPSVTEGDVVYKNGVDFYVTRVEDGIGYIRHCSNDAELYGVHLLIEPYMTVVTHYN